MVALPWSPTEERVFWTEFVPRAPDGSITTKETAAIWANLGKEMDQRMLTIENPSRRQYKGVAMFEHYYFNVEKRLYSPHAMQYVRDYNRQRQAAALERRVASGISAKSKGRGE